MPKLNRDVQVNAFGVDITLPEGTAVTRMPVGGGLIGYPKFAVASSTLLAKLTGNKHDPVYRYVPVPDDAVDTEAK